MKIESMMRIVGSTDFANITPIAGGYIVGGMTVRCAAELKAFGETLVEVANRLMMQSPPEPTALPPEQMQKL